jgi:hypothetical protein
MFTFNDVLAARKNARAFSGVFDLLNRIEYRRIESSEEKEDVLRFRYNCYRSSGYIDENPDRICTDSFDSAPNVTTFGVYEEGRLLSSIRVHYVDKENTASPGVLCYPELLNPMLERGVRFIDSSRFTIDQDVRAIQGSLHFITLRLPILACVYHDVDYSLSVIRPAHGAFYKRFFSFDTWSDVRDYPGLYFQIQLYAGHIASVSKPTLKKLPFMASMESERKLLFSREESRKACFVARPTAELALNRLLSSVEVPADVAAAAEQVA